MKIERSYMRIGVAIQRYKKGLLPSIVRIEYNLRIKFPKTVKNPNYDIVPFYESIRALSHNEVFIAEIKRVRGELGIPLQGLNYFENSKININEKILDSEIKRIKLTYDLPLYLKRANRLYTKGLDNDPLKNIILYNFVIQLQEEERIFYIPLHNDDEDSDPNRFEEAIEAEGLVLKIHRPIKKTDLLTYIRKNWTKIEKDMTQMSLNVPLRKKRILDDLNWKILELVNDKKLTYKEVYNRLGKLHKIKITVSSSLPEEVIKMRYKRSMKKINMLFSKK